jgi:integrase
MQIDPDIPETCDIPECETNALGATWKQDFAGQLDALIQEAFNGSPDPEALRAIGRKMGAISKAARAALKEEIRDTVVAQPKKERPSRSKDELAYWKAAIRMVPGSPYWYAEIQRGKVRRKISLETSNKAAAAHRAREVWHYVRAHGWDGYLAKFKPESQRSANPTVGDYIAAAARTCDLSAKTLRTYVQALRKITGDITDLNGDNRKYGDGRAHREWIARIEAVRLSELSPAKIQEWKRSFLSKAKPDPISQRSAKTSANSFLRSAKSLFAKKVLVHIGLAMPDPIPFAGVQFEPRQSSRYRSTFDIATLIGRARTELASSDPEAFKALLLGAFCGLRRNEIDTLQWDSFLWDRNLIRIEMTEHFQGKSPDSLDDIAVEPQLMDLFKTFYAGRTGTFVIESPEAPRPGCLYDFYRADCVFDRLIVFLRAQGVTSKKPIHELRKQFGSEVCKHFGLYAASQALRHSDIKVTTEHYVESRVHATVGLGHLLDDRKVVEFKQEVA